MLKGQRVYVDANAFVLFVEAHPVFGPQAKLAFDAADLDALTLVTSKVSLAEVLVVPLRSAAAGLVVAYENLLASRPGMETIAVTRSILRRSADLRVSLGVWLIEPFTLPQLSRAGALGSCAKIARSGCRRACGMFG